MAKLQQSKVTIGSDKFLWSVYVQIQWLKLYVNLDEKKLEVIQSSDIPEV